MLFNKKNLLGFALVLMLLMVTSVVSAGLIPTTAPCWVKGTISSSDFNVDTLNVDAYLGTTLLKTSTVSNGVYDFNSLGANDGDTIDLKVDGATFDSFTFVGYCNTSGNPWIVKDFSVSKQPNGESCSDDNICTSGYCTGTICADEPVSSSSSSGASNSSNKSVQVAKTWSVANAQLPMIMNITVDKLDLVQIGLMLNVTKENVKIKISSLSDKPSSVPKLSGDVYLYLKIDKTNFVNNDLSGNATIKFKVKKSWLKENGFDSKDITLQRFTGNWDALITRKLSEDADFVYFEAETPGFSYFAITGEKPINTSTNKKANNSSTTIDEKNKKPVNTNSSTKDQTTETNKKGISVGLIILIVLVLLILVIIYFSNKPNKPSRSKHLHSKKHARFKGHARSIRSRR